MKVQIVDDRRIGNQWYQDGQEAEFPREQAKALVSTGAAKLSGRDVEVFEMFNRGQHYTHLDCYEPGEIPYRQYWGMEEVRCMIPQDELVWDLVDAKTRRKLVDAHGYVLPADTPEPLPRRGAKHE